MNLSERHLRVLADLSAWQRHCAAEAPGHPKVHNRIRKAAAAEYALHQIAGHVNAEGYLAEARDRNRQQLDAHRRAVAAGNVRPNAFEIVQQVRAIAETGPACDALARIRGLIDDWRPLVPAAARPQAAGDAPAGSSPEGSPVGASAPTYGDAA